MPFVVSQVTDVTPIVDGLTSLGRINSPHLDIRAEAALPQARFWIATEPDVVEPGAVSSNAGNANPAERSSNPIAYALVWLVGEEIEIIDVATAPRARRRGAAKRVLTTLLDEYTRARREAAFLEVRAGNDAALALYVGLGFERTRVRRGYYSNGDDAVEMRLELAPLAQSQIARAAP